MTRGREREREGEESRAEESRGRGEERGQRECDRRAGEWGERESAGVGVGGEGGFSVGGTGREKRGKGGGKGVRAEGEGEARGEGAVRRRRSPCSRRLSTDAAGVPGRAARSAAGGGEAREGRRGAPGLWEGGTIPSADGGLAASKASPDANPGPWPGRGVQGARRGVGADRKRRGGLGEGPPSAVAAAAARGFCPDHPLPPLPGNFFL